MASFQPIVGNWYKNPATGHKFEVVATDSDMQLIEIQHFEGEVEEFDEEVWRQLELVELPPQEDWSAPFDDLEPDEIEIDGSANGMRWANPLDQFD